MGEPLDLDAIQARRDALMAVEEHPPLPSSYRLVKSDVPALVAALRDARQRALIATKPAGIYRTELDALRDLRDAVIALTGPITTTEIEAVRAEGLSIVRLTGDKA